MHINMKTAIVIYIFINKFAYFQFLNSQLVDTNLPNSKEPAIIIAAIVAPENNKPIPYMLKYAAHSAIITELPITKCCNLIISINIT